MRYLTIAAFAAVLIATTVTGSVQAGPPGQGYSITYYDSTGEVVGEVHANCGGEYTSWGARTEVFEKRTWICV